VQVSVQPALGPRHHLALGQALAPLAGEGVLIVGSGHLTHNLRELRSVRETGVGTRRPPYVSEFQEWVRGCIEARDASASPTTAGSPRTACVRIRPRSTSCRCSSRSARRRAGYRAERFIDHVEGGVLAMDAYLFR
jgi:4,5-DOPA dioxygenase extradiol